MRKFEHLNSILGMEFDRHVMEHPDFAARIPRGAHIVLQLEGNDAYNRWMRDISERHREKDEPVLIVHVKGLHPPKFRIARPIISKSA